MVGEEGRLGWGRGRNHCLNSHRDIEAIFLSSSCSLLLLFFVFFFFFFNIANNYV